MTVTEIATENALVLARRLRAPVERVFDAWLDPAQLRRFLTPGCTLLGEVRLDARVGGEFLFEMLDSGRSLPHQGRYEVIERPRRLVFTWNSHATEGDSRVELTFAPRGDETLLTLRHERLPNALRVGQHTGGWSAILAKLADGFAPAAGDDDFKLTLELAAPPAAVFRALTTQAGIAAWWTADCSAEPRQGGRLEARFPASDFSVAMTVTRFDPDREVGWTCIACSHPAAAGYADRADWVGTRLGFTLEPAGAGTRLHFVHEGLRALECAGVCTAGWGHCLESLQALLATGQGRPAGAGGCPAAAAE